MEADDRDRLESLIRYVARPAVSLERLEIRQDGKIEWSLKRAWKDGTRAFIFDPNTFLERLAALVPHPREHSWTNFGSLAPAESWTAVASVLVRLRQLGPMATMGL